MSPKKSPGQLRAWLVSLALAATTAASAQPAPTSTQSGEKKAEVIELSPFSVTSTGNRGYMATNTLSGTALNTPLKDVPMSISVITSELLRDTSPIDLEHALQINSSVTKVSRTSVTRQQNWAIRGFVTRNVLVNGVSAAAQDIPVELIDRIEIVKGPNTLYGQSDPGGLINVITKRPAPNDHLELSVQAGDRGLLAGSLDASTGTSDQKLRLRVFGSHRESDGFRVVDGGKSDFIGLIGEWRVRQGTNVNFMVSDQKLASAPSGWAPFPFQVRPTDLNGDGVIDSAVVDGVTESGATYLNDFLPYDFTSQTIHDRRTQRNRYFQAGVEQSMGSHLVLNYQAVRTMDEDETNTRTFNTFSAALSGPMTYEHNTMKQRTDVHTLQGLLTLETGALKHNLLIGGRYSYDYGRRRFNVLSPGTGGLEAMRAAGRNIRLQFSKNDALSTTKYWLEDAPTSAEVDSLGRSQSGTLDYSETRVSSAYLSDSISLLEDRLKLFGGLRGIRIQTVSVDQSRSSSTNDARDVCYQIGGVYALNQTVGVFANTATSFNPNGVDPTTGSLYPAEASEAYEAGLKLGNFWGGRLSGTLSVFNIRKNNVVRRDLIPETIESSVRTFVTDLTDDESKGWEVELFANPISNWQIVFSYSHDDAKTVKSQTIVKGLPLRAATPNRYTLWNSFEFDKGPLKGLRLGGGFVIAEGPILQFGTTPSRYVLEDGYTLLNIFARYKTKIADHAVTFGANVDNLNDTHYFAGTGIVGTPRQLSFSAAIEF